MKGNLIIAKLNYEVRLHEKNKTKILCYKINKEKSKTKNFTWKNQFSIFMKAKIPQKPIKFCGWELYFFFLSVVVAGTNWNDGWKI